MPDEWNTRSHCLAVSPDGQVLAVSIGTKIGLYAPRTGAELARLEHPDPDHGSVSSLAFSANGRQLASASFGQVILWDVTAALGRQDRATKPLTQAEKDALWQDLASADAAVANRAIARLVETPANELADYLRPRLIVADKARMARLIADLNSGEFAVRRQATEALEALDDLAEPALRRALADKPPLEIARRLEALLIRLERPFASPAGLRQLRALEVLESSGSSQAETILKELASGEGRLAQQARHAAERLARRNELASIAKPK
jgi:hypothetical protein